MGLFKAITKGVLRQVNNLITDRDTQKAKSIAFSNTGDKIKKAKKGKYRINASATYQKDLEKQTKLINRRHEERNQFLDDFFD